MPRRRGACVGKQDAEDSRFMGTQERPRPGGGEDFAFLQESIGGLRASIRGEAGTRSLGIGGIFRRLAREACATRFCKLVPIAHIFSAR